MEPLIAPGSLREEVPATQRRSRPRGLPDGQPDQHRSTPGSRHAYNKYAHSSRNHRPCRSCGQIHSHHEPHLYNYTDEVDEDLMCQICLQPFVQPVDTPCAHTFCHVCISNYLKINPLCPLDRKPLSEMTINPTNLVLKRLLDKLEVNCPNEDSCEEVVSRGSLSDHLRYRCLGTLVACQFASAGCEYRGPTKSMNKHQNECQFKKEGITRLPILEGEVSHIEIPRTRPSLGMTIVGGSDTPLVSMHVHCAMGHNQHHFFMGSSRAISSRRLHSNLSNLKRGMNKELKELVGKKFRVHSVDEQEPTLSQ